MDICWRFDNCCCFLRYDCPPFVAAVDSKAQSPLCCPVRWHVLVNISRTGFGQVHWCLQQADDFFGSKTGLGQDSAIKTCCGSASRFLTSSQCFDMLARWTLENDRLWTCSTLFWYSNLLIYCYNTVWKSSVTSFLACGTLQIVFSSNISILPNNWTKFDRYYCQKWKFN